MMIDDEGRGSRLLLGEGEPRPKTMMGTELHVFLGD